MNLKILYLTQNVSISSSHSMMGTRRGVQGVSSPCSSDTVSQRSFLSILGYQSCMEMKPSSNAYLKENLLLSPHTTLSWNDVSSSWRRGIPSGDIPYITHGSAHCQRIYRKMRLCLDKEAIENKLGTTVSLFAYPFGGSGDYTEVTKGIVEGSGYTHAHLRRQGSLLTIPIAMQSHGCVSKIISHPSP
jgi:hypothetical protein